MKYENAKDILPAKLLEEVQKYAAGRVIYVPKKEKQIGWGEASGYRETLKKRNTLICNRYSAGQSVLEIAEEFCLSPETVKKLVYGKKMNTAIFSLSIASAEQFAAAGMGEEWVRIYLAEKGISMPDDEKYFMSELVKIPLRLISKETVGDKAQAKSHIKGEIDIASDRFSTSEATNVPLIVFYKNHCFEVPYQRKLLEELQKEKRNSYYAFIFSENKEYDIFQNNYGKHFQR